MFLRGLARCFREAEGREKMLAARWFANSLLILICVALLLDFCSCAKVPKETATELEDVLGEDFNNGFANGAFVHNTEKLVEDDGENVEDENGWTEEEEDQDEIDNEDRHADNGQEGEEESENRDEDGDEDDNDLYEEDKTGEYEDDINTEDQYPGDGKDGEEESENGDGDDDEDDNDLSEDEYEIERNEIEGQGEDEDGDVDVTSDLTAMENANEAQVAVRENEGKVFRLKEKSVSG